MAMDRQSERFRTLMSRLWTRQGSHNTAQSRLKIDLKPRIANESSWLLSENLCFLCLLGLCNFERRQQKEEKWTRKRPYCREIIEISD